MILFHGIPTLSLNKSEAKAFPPGIFSGGLLEVRNNLVHADVDMSRVELIPGWYSDTLNHETAGKIGLQAAAIVNVDCDVYESTVPVLNFVEPYLIDGSIVIFDDWYCFANRESLGEQKAFKEWLERNGHLRATPYKEYGWDGKAFIINRTDRKNSVMTRSIDGKINFWNSWRRAIVWLEERGGPRQGEPQSFADRVSRTVGKNRRDTPSKPRMGRQAGACHPRRYSDRRRKSMGLG